MRAERLQRWRLAVAVLVMTVRASKIDPVALPPACWHGTFIELILLSGCGRQLHRPAPMSELCVSTFFAVNTFHDVAAVEPARSLDLPQLN